MTVHWRELDTPAKIEAIRAVFEPGMSASQIAAHFNGATRNAVIGLFHRHIEKIGGELRNRDNYTPKKKRISLRRPIIRTRTRKALPQFEVQNEAHLCGRPLTELKARECRWPVNDAEAGELHLFCSMPTEGGSYCDHHDMRANRRPE